MRLCYANGFENMGSYVSSFFSSGYRPAGCDKVCYTYYDFANDQLPELLISAYYKESNTYAIVDAFGTDGTTVSKLLGKEEDGGVPYINYIFSDNNMILARWATSGMSHIGDEIFELVPGGCGCKVCVWHSIRWTGKLLSNRYRRLGKCLPYSTL